MIQYVHYTEILLIATGQLWTLAMHCTLRRRAQKRASSPTWQHQPYADSFALRAVTPASPLTRRFSRCTKQTIHCVLERDVHLVPVVAAYASSVRTVAGHDGLTSNLVRAGLSQTG